MPDAPRCRRKDFTHNGFQSLCLSLPLSFSGRFKFEAPQEIIALDVTFAFDPP